MPRKMACFIAISNGISVGDGDAAGVAIAQSAKFVCCFYFFSFFFGSFASLVSILRLGLINMYTTYVGV